MKQHLFKAVLLFVLTIVVTCCKKEVDPVPTIIGTWEQTCQSAVGCSESSANYTFKCPENEHCDTYTFVLEGSKYTLSNESIGSVPLSSGTYTISGNQLTLISDLDGEPFIVTFSLTATTLVMTWKASGNGCTYTFTYCRK